MAKISSIYPIPTLPQLEKMKKKWYKKNINGDFDPTWDVNAPADTGNASQETNTEPQETTPNTDNGAQGSGEISGLNSRQDFSAHKLYHIEGILKLLFLSLTWVTPFFRLAKIAIFVVGLVTCYLGMTRQIGQIKLSKEFLQKALSNEFGVSVFFFLTMVGVPVLSPFNWLPVSTHFLIGATEFIIRGGYKLLQRKKFLDFSVSIRSWKNDIKIAKGYVELFTLFYYLVIAIMGKFSILIVFIFGHYLKFRYKLN